MTTPLPASSPTLTRRPVRSQGHRVVRARSSRGGQRGAAMVEAAFMMPMFVLLFFTSLYAHNLNAKQISLNIESRSEAWGFAMNNCGAAGQDETESLPSISTGDGLQEVQLYGESGNDAASAAGTALSGGNVTGAISSIASGIVGAIANVLPNPYGSQASFKTTVDWRQPNVWSGAKPTGSGNVQQTVTVLCNQEPQDGNIETAVKGIICAITGKAC